MYKYTILSFYIISGSYSEDFPLSKYCALIQPLQINLYNLDGLALHKLAEFQPPLFHIGCKGPKFI